MNQDPRRKSESQPLRERVDRLLRVHEQLRELTTYADENVFNAVRNLPLEEAEAKLDDLVMRQVRLLKSVEQELSEYRRTSPGFLSKDEIAALLGIDAEIPESGKAERH